LEAQVVKIQMVREGAIQYGGPIYNSGGCYEAIKGMFDGADREIFAVVCLNSKGRINAVNVVSVGTLTTSLVHCRETFKAAILSNSASVILAHNHPGGDPIPSPEDKEITSRVVEAGKILGISVLDHIILGEDCYYSMADNCELGLGLGLPLPKNKGGEKGPR